MAIFLFAGKEMTPFGDLPMCKTGPHRASSNCARTNDSHWSLESVTAALTNRTRATWLFDPTAAATASLVTVTFFTLVLGVGFLPHELRLLSPSQYVSVTHSIVADSNRPSVSLYWTIARSGAPGWRHHLALHSPKGIRSGSPFPWSKMNPLSLAKAVDDDHVLVGDWDGRIYSIDTRDPKSEPECIGRQSDGGAIALATSA